MKVLWCLGSVLRALTNACLVFDEAVRWQMARIYLQRDQILLASKDRFKNRCQYMDYGVGPCADHTGHAWNMLQHCQWDGIQIQMVYSTRTSCWSRTYPGCNGHISDIEKVVLPGNLCDSARYPYLYVSLLDGCGPSVANSYHQINSLTKIRCCQWRARSSGLNKEKIRKIGSFANTKT